MPMILLCLFGIFMAVTSGALSERTQLAVRYGGMIGAVDNPANSTSIYALAATIDGMDPNSNTCASAAADTALLTAGRKAFWQPVSGSITTTCWQQRETMFAGTSNPSYYYGYNFIVHDTFVTAGANSPVNIFLTKGALRGATSVGTFAAEDFTSTGTLADMLECTYVGPVVKASVESGTYQPPLDYLSLNNGPNPGNPGNPNNNGGAWSGSNTAALPTTLPVLINMPYPMTCNNYSQASYPQPTATPFFGPPIIHTAPAS